MNADRLKKFLAMARAGSGAEVVLALRKAGQELETAGLVLEDLAAAAERLGHPDHGPDCRVVQRVGGAALDLWSARPTAEVPLPDSARAHAETLARRLAGLMAEAAEAGTTLALKVERPLPGETAPGHAAPGDAAPARLMAGLAGGRLVELWAGPPGDAGVLAAALRRTLKSVL